MESGSRQTSAFFCMYSNFARLVRKTKKHRRFCRDAEQLCFTTADVSAALEIFIEIEQDIC